MFRRRDKKQAATFAVLGTLYGIVAISVIIGIIFSAETIREADTAAQVLSGILFLDFTLTIITGTASAISFLFLSKDNEFSGSLPVKPSTVFLAKFTVLLLLELMVSLIIIFPTFLTLGIVLGLPALFYAMIPVAILAVPIFAAAVISIISMPIVFLSTKLKNRGLLKTILALTVFIGFFALYFILINSFSSDEGIDFSGFVFTNYIIYPLYMLMNFATRTSVFDLNSAQSMLVSFCIFIVPIIGLLVFSYMLSKLAYHKIIRKSLESSGNLSSKSGQFITGTAKGAVVKKEWRMIIRDSSVAINTIAMILIAPIVIIFTTIGIGSTGLGGSEITPETIALTEWAIGIMMLMMMAVGINGSSSCISREGAQFYYMKMLPISFKDQIRAKQRFYYIVSFVAIVLSLSALSIVLFVRGSLTANNWWIIPLVLTSAFAWAIAITNLSIYFDLKDPKLDWHNIREVVKRLKNQAVYLVWMVFAIVLFGGMVGGVAAIGNIGGNAGMFIAIYLGAASGLGCLAAFLFDSLLHNNAKRFFNRL